MFIYFFHVLSGIWSISPTEILTTLFKSVPSSLCPVPCAQFPVPSSQFPVPSSQFPVPSSQCPVPSAIMSPILHEIFLASHTYATRAGKMNQKPSFGRFWLVDFDSTSHTFRTYSSPVFELNVFLSYIQFHYWNLCKWLVWAMRWFHFLPHCSPQSKILRKSTRWFAFCQYKENLFNSLKQQLLSDRLRY